jgi:uncharacterized coiled-coil protein SlyX
MIRLKFHEHTQPVYYSQGYYGVNIEPGETADLKDDHRTFADHLIELGWAEEIQLSKKEMNSFAIKALREQVAAEQARVEADLATEQERANLARAVEELKKLGAEQMAAKAAETPPGDPADAPTHGGAIKKKEGGKK